MNYCLSGDKRKQGVIESLCVALPFTLTSILRQKEELWKLKYLTMQKNIIFKKIPLQETKMPFKML
jgi:hypothetical protein